MYGVIDCNNFYVSCERIFNPKLEKIPVVVLSNNDGCVISRSYEVKELGLQMGAPIFKYRDLVEKNNVQVFSANFPLYADISSRVMNCIREFSPRMEVYSIDEAFVDFSEFSIDKLQDHSKKLRNRILKGVGIPVSVGVASTKTLAKIGSEIAKKHKNYEGICVIKSQIQKDTLLKSLEVADIWGIGRRLSVFLQSHGIFTAYQLMHCEDSWVQKQMSISVLRTVWELRGIPCIELEWNHDPKKSIISSRSFGHKVEKLSELREAVSTFAARAAEKVREERETASYITVAIVTDYHNKKAKQYFNSKTVVLPWPTDYTPTISSQAVKILDSIYKSGYRYKKATVVLTGLTPKTTFQSSLFHSEDADVRESSLMKVMDYTNKVWGSGTLQFASQGLKPKWKGLSANRSPRYTTRWEELLVVKS